MHKKGIGLNMSTGDKKLKAKYSGMLSMWPIVVMYLNCSSAQKLMYHLISCGKTLRVHSVLTNQSLDA